MQRHSKHTLAILAAIMMTSTSLAVAQQEANSPGNSAKDPDTIVSVYPADQKCTAQTCFVRVDTVGSLKAIGTQKVYVRKDEIPEHFFGK